MESILISLIASLLESAQEFIDGLIMSIVPIALYAEEYMGNIFGGSGFSNTFKIVYDFGIALIILKFLKKIFDYYVSWTEGDSNEEPLSLLTNFTRALLVAVGSQTLYAWLATGVEDFTEQILKSISADTALELTSFITGIASAGIFNALLILIYMIIFFFIYIQFLMRGMEMLILRIGLPLACVGLLDSDKGVFGGYMKKFFQSCLTIIIQITLFKVSIGLMTNLHPFWAIACISLALKTPRFLQDLLIMSGGQTSVSGAYHSVQMISTITNAISKKGA